MRKVTIKIDGKAYDINLKEDFAKSLEEELEKELPPYHNNSTKDLLNSYLKKCYDCYVLEQKIENLLKKIPIN